MKRGLTGHYVPLPSAGENARAFVPNPLPPSPPLELGPEIQELVEKAMLALGRLDGLTTVLPDAPGAKLGITRETTGRNYGRIYSYDKISQDFEHPEDYARRFSSGDHCQVKARCRPRHRGNAMRGFGRASVMALQHFTPTAVATAETLVACRHGGLGTSVASASRPRNLGLESNSPRRPL